MLNFPNLKTLPLKKMQTLITPTKISLQILISHSMSLLWHYVLKKKQGHSQFITKEHLHTVGTDWSILKTSFIWSIILFLEIKMRGGERDTETVSITYFNS